MASTRTVSQWGVGMQFGVEVRGHLEQVLARRTSLDGAVGSVGDAHFISLDSAEHELEHVLLQ